uniref:YlqD protein n=1 Tax=Ammonifex degensii TaxID=42838 RepID=A0A7C1F3L2_9THEO
MEKMDRITITRPVIIKARVTEKYKEFLLANLTAAITEAEREVQRVEFQAKRLRAERKGNPAPVELEELERLRREKTEARERLKRQFEAIKQLPPGAEIIQGRTESLVEIGIGDDAKRLGPVEIIIEEGKVVALREQGLGK